MKKKSRLNRIHNSLFRYYKKRFFFEDLKKNQTKVQWQWNSLLHQTNKRKGFVCIARSSYGIIFQQDEQEMKRNKINKTEIEG